MSAHDLPTAGPAEVRQRVRRLLVERRGPAAVVLLLTAAATGAGLAGPLLIGRVVDAVADGGPGASTTVARASLAFALLAIAAGALGWAARVRAAVVGEGVLAELRTEVFDHALAAPVERVERAGVGELVARLTGDVSTLARAVRTTLPTALLAAVELVLAVGALALLDLRLAAVAVAASLPPLLVGGRWYLRHAPERYRRERQRHGALTRALHEAYLGRDVLAAHGAADRHRAGLVASGAEVLDAEMATTSARNRLRPSVAAAQALALVAVLAAGAGFVATGSASLGAVSAAALLIVRLFEPVGVLLEEADEVQQASAALARLVGVVQLPADGPAHLLPDGAGADPPRPRTAGAAGAPAVELRGATFGYVPGEPALREVDVAIGAGERVVVVGPSGAGKTTMATLISGLRRPWRGAVLLWGRPASEVGAEERARHVVVVAQEGHTFARSVADNVRLARPDATDAEVEAALLAVGADGWVARLPRGPATLVGAGHHQLSPPQAQQLALARVLCADPAVVVLDEATGELDPASAARTERHLEAALRGRTVITIAHRLDVAPEADRVLVVEAGRLVADGPHEELLDTSAAYRRMWDGWVAPRPGAAQRASSSRSSSTNEILPPSPG